MTSFRLQSQQHRHFYVHLSAEIIGHISGYAVYRFVESTLPLQISLKNQYGVVEDISRIAINKTDTPVDGDVVEACLVKDDESFVQMGLCVVHE